MPKRRGSATRSTYQAAPRRSQTIPNWFLLALLLGAAYFGYAYIKSMPAEEYGYKVISVKSGAVWAVDKYGEYYEFRDAHLVKAALTGKLKAGDVINP